jgi:hypothetical protein
VILIYSRLPVGFLCSTFIVKAMELIRLGGYLAFRFLFVYPLTTASHETSSIYNKQSKAKHVVALEMLPSGKGANDE